MSKPTLVLIHGLVGSQKFYDPRARMPDVCVLAEDLLGYGQHVDTPAERLTLATQADHIAELIDGRPEQRVWLLGHSMGGAVAVLAAERRPGRVHGIVNVEGNFTERDAFWSRKIAASSPEEWAASYREMRADPAAWLERCQIRPDSRRTRWAEDILANQPASTLRAMSSAILAETLYPSYLETVRRLLDGGLMMHLIAGQSSAAAWDVPAFVRSAAASYTEQPNAGHFMMLEDPDAFCGIVVNLIAT
jgi:pimeloyl-ACP methyl ester carboxylesterase